MNQLNYLLLPFILANSLIAQAQSQEREPPSRSSESKAIVPSSEVFSGPQIGEKLSPFKVRGVFDDQAGKDLDFVTGAAGKPIVLIFVHDVNRQSISMTRTLSSYTATRSKDGLTTGIVWLSDDATEAEATLKRVRHALVGTGEAPSASTLVKDLVGVSLEGREGPGSYGLNRNVILTILVGKDNKVTANFALIQPSIQVDLPKILESIVAVVGGKVPKLEELPGMREMMQNRANSSSETPNLRPLLTPLIKKDATVEEVDKAAKAIQEKADSDRSVRAEVARIAKTIVDSGKIANYGTPAAQEYLKRWAKEFKD
jgi:hypothetical protein